MEEIALHVLDIAENAVRADATMVEIRVTRDAAHNLLRIEVIDDGRGMEPETLRRARDPFFTTKGKKTGLGLPLLAQAAEQAGGTLVIDSTPGAGTRVATTFGLSNVDRPAIGSMTDTIMTLIAGSPGLEVLFIEQDGERVFRFDTREIRLELDDVPINAPKVLQAVRELLEQEIRLKQ